MTACWKKDCLGQFIPARPRVSVIDTVWWVCDVCGSRQHPAACVDDEGKVECVCGLDDLRRDEAA